MSSRAMERKFTRSYKNLVSIKKISFEQSNSKNIFDSRSSMFQMKKMKTLCKPFSVPNIAINFNGIPALKLLSENLTKGNYFQIDQTEYEMNLVNFLFFSIS